jgi:hypothetical protein
MDMTKFETADDPGFIAVSGELRRWIKEIGRSESAELSLPVVDTPRIVQGGSRFGSTTVSGGSLYQGNFVG